MIGIYKITNRLNNKSYIGQSRNIEARFRSHITSHSTQLSLDIHEFGVDNFEFEIIQECSEDNLDRLEEFYIDYFDTIHPNGYNLIAGGQHNHGESNPNAKLSKQDVYYIREQYAQHKPTKEVYAKFKDKIAYNSFLGIWEGESWPEVHMDVYTPENKEYYATRLKVNNTSCAENSNNIFTPEEVDEMRRRYVNESAKQIYESVKDRCSFQTLQQILWGRYYDFVIPIYDKKHKEWVF